MNILDNLITEFSIETLKQFFRQKISTFKYDEENYDYLFEDDNYEDITKIGEAVLKNSDELLVCTAKTLAPLSDRSGKKRQFDIAKKILNEENQDAAFFIFYDESGKFRFSFIKANFVGATKSFTDFKRYTYFVSPSQTNNTFKTQINVCNFKDLDSILQAFSVEPLNKQFYEEIAKAFYSLIDSDLKLPSYDIKTNRKIYQEFAVRLIGRTIFIWFLKNKSLIPDNWLSSQRVRETPDYYHQLLEKLFFQILNQPIDKRIADLPEGQASIPFLNGGLFEPRNDDFYDASARYINVLKIPNQWLENFFATLERFHFTIDENSLNDTEVSIDPEMLGTIFENLLAEIDPDTEKSARKSTGSFYTPREIVDYMVEESLVSYLRSKTNTDEKQLHELFKENNLTDSDYADKHGIIDAFDQIKIFDPACGSGAFPMGALHKINMALQKLDPDAKIWKQKQLAKINNVAYRNALKDKLDKSNVEYIRKLGIIQNSIYGVDIQTIATEISKLRCFLSLVVDENINDDADNRGIYPLPNLEFKFVTANSLIGLEAEKPQETLDYTKTNDDIEKLQNIRDEYLQAYGDDKEVLKEQFLKLQKEIAYKQFNGNSEAINKNAMQLISWNPFKYEESDWFNPKWMFGVEAFDVVIGNPPYIQLQKARNGTEKYADLYKNENFATFARTGDIYALFYEKGIRLLKPNGLLCYITSNKWMRANYGKSLRKFFSRKNPLKLIDLGPGIFNTATVDTNILLIENSEPKKIALKALTLTDKEKLNSLSDKDFTVLTDLSEDSWIILSPEEYRIKQRIEQIGTPLKDWDIKINYGIKTGYNEAFIIDGATKDKLIETDSKSAEIIKPILRGRDIKRYKAEFADLWLIFIPWHFPLHKDSTISGASKKAEKAFQEQYPALYEHLLQYKDKLSKRNKAETGIRYEWYALQRCAASYYEEFEKEKIVYPNMTKFLPFIYDKNAFYTNQKCFIVTGKSLKYLVSILNSTVSHYYIRQNLPELQGGTRELSKVFFIHHPVPKISLSQQKPFEILVDLILFAKEKGLEKEAEKFESVIDGLVYDLYFKEEMKQANCYLTDRINEVIQPVAENATDEEKMESIKKFYEICSKDKIIFHSLIHRRTVKVVQIINGDK